MADAQNGKGFSQLTSVIGNINSVANSSRRGPREAVDIGRNWKPVNFGEYQGLGEILPMQASTVGPASSPPSSKQQTGTDISVSPPLATAAVDKLMKDGILLFYFLSVSYMFGNCGMFYKDTQCVRFGNSRQ